MKKQAKRLPLEQIRIFPDQLTRNSLIKLMEENKVDAIKENLSELTASMKAIGQIECIGVKEIEGLPTELLKEDGIDAVYILVFGLRRFLAAELLGWKTILATCL